MPLNLTVNGVTYQYPEKDDQDWGEQATAWAQAITQGLLQKSGGLFSLTAEVDFGAAFGIKALQYATRAADVANSGEFRLGNGDEIAWRNGLDSADLTLSIIADELWFNGVNLSSTAAGNVTGPLSSTDESLVRFDGITGQLIQESVVSLSDAGALTGVTAVNTVDVTATGAVVISGTSGHSVTTEFADEIGVEMSATGSDALLAQGTSVGADAIASQIGDTAATTLFNQRQRASAVIVGEGGIAISDSSGSFFQSGPVGPTDVPNCDVTITTGGRPVMLMLIADGISSDSRICVRDSDNASAPLVTANVLIDRDGGVIAGTQVTAQVSNLGNGGIIMCIGSGAIQFVDTPIGGTYTYKAQVEIATADEISVVSCRLIAYEL